MILFYFSDNTIHQIIPGFGAVTEQSGTYWIDDWNTTSKTADLQWKYIADQTIVRDELGAYLHNADYYDPITAEPTEKERLTALEDVVAALLEG